MTSEAPPASFCVQFLSISFQSVTVPSLLPFQSRVLLVVEKHVVEQSTNEEQSHREQHVLPILSS